MVSDGRFIIYSVQGTAAGNDLWLLTMSGDRKPTPFLTTRFNEAAPTFSPDGRWVAYQSNESGRNEIYVTPFPQTGAKWQVSTAGGTEPRWRKDSHEIFYLSD